MAAPARKFGVEAFREALAPDVAVQRKEAFERFAAVGLPHHKIEAWKYTSLVHLARSGFQPAPANFELDGPLPARMGDAARAVFVNGRYSDTLSDAPVAGFASLAHAHAEFELGDEAEDDPMLALTAAMAEDGAVLTLDGSQGPIELLYITAPGASPQMAHVRNRIDVTGGEALVIERHVAMAAGESTLNNGSTEITLGEAAKLTHIKLQAEAENANHVWHHTVSIPARAQYTNYVVSVGGALARNRLTVKLLGEGADCVLDGAYSARGKQHLDHTSKIVHAVADTTSRQVYKGVLDDHGRGVFQGHIVVAEDAQRTDGHQLNRALMLSDHAEIDSKPMLEIYADDVKCSHGATIGELDSEAKFYLMSRGLDRITAERLVVLGFLGEVLARLPLGGVVEKVTRAIEGKLANHG